MCQKRLPSVFFAGMLLPFYHRRISGEAIRVAVPLLLLAVVIACRSTHPLPVSRDTIIVATSTSPTNLDPRIGIDKASENFHHLLFNGLLRKDDDGRMVPDLASSSDKTGIAKD